jgi:hypothetical protein
MKRSMLEPEDRDRELHKLYAGREFWLFTRGEDWFNQQVRAIHREWQRGSGMGDCTIDPTYALEQMCWEQDNGLLEGA